MYETSEIKKGLKIEIDGAPWSVVDFQFVKPGKGCAFTRTKMKNLVTGAVLDRTYKTGETLAPADVEEWAMSYLYKEGNDYLFMNTQDFEQVSVPHEVVGDQYRFLLDQLVCKVLMFKQRPVALELPNFIDVEITYAEPGSRGNTATNTLKNATISTGADIKVPLFIETGEWIRIDTRTGDYNCRVANPNA